MNLNAKRQAEWRARQKAKLAQVGVMGAALAQIVTELAGNEKPLAVKLRQIAQRGLGE